MSRPDAERSMEIYRNFTKQTDFVVAYLSTARQYEHQTRVEVPKLKHAPVNLGKQLEDYLRDPDFEINRRQYIAEQESKKGWGTNGASKSAPKPELATTVAKSFPPSQSSAPNGAAQPVKAPAPDLIDFFESIEQPPAPQQQAAPSTNGNGNGNPFGQIQSPYVQQNGFSSPPTNPYQSPNQFQQQQQPFNTGFQAPQQQQLQPNFTGAGFGGYTPQQSFQPGGLSSIPQDQATSFQQQQNPQMLGAQETNPFRQSMLPNHTGVAASPMMPQQTGTNPFARSMTMGATRPPPAFQAPQSAPLPSAEFQRPLTTGTTNPFARNMSMSAATPRPTFESRPQTSGDLLPQATGSTNPFR